MKETSTVRHTSGSSFSNTTRDLDIVFEESEPQQQQHLDDASSLNFLRHKVSFPTHYTSSTSEAPSFSMPAVRRARAGTMPSFIQQPSESINNNRNTHSSLLLTAIESGRHRSGSLNLPPVDPSYWGLTSDGPLSPSSEQLLQNDDDFSIARTMRSLGLEEGGNKSTTATSNGGGLFHHPTPPEFLMPSRSLLSGNNRNRSYSVNATARYETEQPPPVPRAAAVNYMGSLEGFGRQHQQNRPRASSMGRADNNSMSLSMGMWGNQRSSPLGSMREEYEQQDSQTSLSLGDSELLANMIHSNNNTTIYDQNESHHHSSDNIPYLHYSQSTPTFRDASNQQPLPSMSNSTAAQTTTRSLWIGNIDGSVTIDLLTQVFSIYGPIESVRLLTEKECGFVNFYHAEDAIRAKEEILGKMGGRVGTCVVRIGYGKADAAVSDVNTSQPTRALWLGNISGTMTPSSLQAIFSRFGTVESVRVLSHKNCGFVNFELVESAVAARNALVQNETGAQEFAGVRVGFAKVPPPKSPPSGESGSDDAKSSEVLDSNDIWLKDLSAMMVQLGVESSKTQHFVKGLKTTSSYYDSIPPVPELGSNRKFDAAHLREMRKRSDNAVRGKKEAEAIAAECMDDIAEISSDYIGNTVVQRLFEKCSEETKTAMLERIGPHLAALSIHKNGTWATQKIIDLANTPEQILLISHHLKPYIPPLLLDQFGNYAVQGCLRLGNPDRIQFILDAIVEKLMTIAQGRFGARAMRGILENENVTIDQQKFVAAALCQNATSLSTNANGALLLSWLMESTHTEGRMSMLASKLSSHLIQLSTHKLGSQIIYKLMNQTEETAAQDILLEQLLSVEDCLYEILSDQVRGVPLIQKIIDCTHLSKEKRLALSERVCIELNKLKGPGHKKLLEYLLESNQDTQ